MVEKTEIGVPVQTCFYPQMNDRLLNVNIGLDQ